MLRLNLFKITKSARVLIVALVLELDEKLVTMREAKRIMFLIKFLISLLMKIRPWPQTALRIAECANTERQFFLFIQKKLCASFLYAYIYKMWKIQMLAYSLEIVHIGLPNNYFI